MNVIIEEMVQHPVEKSGGLLLIAQMPFSPVRGMSVRGCAREQSKDLHCGC
jgi:hypothetical protein